LLLNVENREERKKGYLGTLMQERTRWLQMRNEKTPTRNTYMLQRKSFNLTALMHAC
jgi:hypothetical protein